MQARGFQTDIILSNCYTPIRTLSPETPPHNHARRPAAPGHFHSLSLRPLQPATAPLSLLPPLAAVPETQVPAQPEHHQLCLYPDLLHLRPGHRRNLSPRHPRRAAEPGRMLTPNQGLLFITSLSENPLAVHLLQQRLALSAVACCKGIPAAARKIKIPWTPNANPLNPQTQRW